MLKSLQYHQTLLAKEMLAGGLFKSNHTPKDIQRRPFLGVSVKVIRKLSSHLVEFFKTGTTTIPDALLCIGVLDHAAQCKKLDPFKLAVVVELLTGHFVEDYIALGEIVGTDFDITMYKTESMIQLNFHGKNTNHSIVVPEPALAEGDESFLNIQLHGLYPVVHAAIAAHQAKKYFWLSNATLLYTPRQEANNSMWRHVVMSVLVEIVRTITGCRVYTTNHGALAIYKLVDVMISSGHWDYFVVGFEGHTATVSNILTPVKFNAMVISADKIEFQLSNPAVFHPDHLAEASGHLGFIQIVSTVATPGQTNSGLCLFYDASRRWLKDTLAGKNPTVAIHTVTVDRLTDCDVEYRCMVVVQKGLLSVFKIATGELLFEAQIEKK